MVSLPWQARKHLGGETLTILAPDPYGVAVLRRVSTTTAHALYVKRKINQVLNTAPGESETG